MRMHVTFPLWAKIILFVCCGCGNESPISTAENADPHAAVAGTSMPSPAPIQRTQPGAFTDVTELVGLDFVRTAGEAGEYWLPENTSGGAALFDYDGDGDLDIYFVNGAHRGEGAQAHAGEPPSRNRLYRHDPGPRFVDVTDASGAGDTGYGIAVAAGDYDNDGHVDLYVVNVGPDAMYRNNGDGTFTDVSDAAGIRDDRFGGSATFLDYDVDGDLDLFVTGYVDIERPIVCNDPGGRREYCGPHRYHAVPSILYRNDGDGTFTDVSESSGIAGAPSKSLGVVTADVNADGRPDIFVANDEEPNQLWINRGDGTFRDEALVWGAAVDTFGRAGAGMGIAVGDVDGDGRFDLFITHLGSEVNTLYRNVDHARMQDDTMTSGLANRPAYTGWGAVFLDYDNDGDEDLAIATGRIARGPLLVDRPAGVPPRFWDDYAEPNLLYDNRGDGRFVNTSGQAGDFTAHVESSRGMAAGDIDNDGDVDLLVVNASGPARLYRNDRGSALGDDGHWLVVRAFDPSLNRDAYGAQVTVVTKDGVARHRLLHPAYSFASSNDPRGHFGLGAQAQVERIDVRWPDGAAESFPAMSADRIVTLNKGSGRNRTDDGTT